MTRLAHMHVPKCGGTSQLAILRKWYGINHVLRYDRPTAEQFGKYDVVSGHFPYNEEFWDYKWISFMRHPVDRLKSFYYYTTERGKKSSRNYWWNIIKDMTLEQWLTSPHSRNLMIKQFAGKTPQEDLEPGDIKKAHKNADSFFFIGFQETFNDDVRRLAKLLGKPEPKIPHKLRSKNPGLQNDSLYGHDVEFEFYTELRNK